MRGTPSPDRAGIGEIGGPAARTNVVSAKSTIPGADVHQFPEQKFIVPVVSDTVEPVDLEQASIGVALFALPLIVAPMVVPALF